MMQMRIVTDPQLSKAKKITTIKKAHELMCGMYNKDDAKVFEYFNLGFLDGELRLIGCFELAKGTRGAVMVDIGVICGLGILCNATSVIISHNHPNGVMVPSKDDIKLTKNIAKALELFDMNIFDHIIINGQDLEKNYYSFYEKGKL